MLFRACHHKQIFVSLHDFSAWVLCVGYCNGREDGHTQALRWLDRVATDMLTRALLSLVQRPFNLAATSSGLTCLPQLLHAAASPWLHVERHQQVLSLLSVRHLHAPSSPALHKLHHDPLRPSPQYNSTPNTEWFVDPASIKHEPPATVLQLPDGYDPRCPDPEYTVEGSMDGPYEVGLQKVFAVVKVGNKQYKVRGKQPSIITFY